MTLYDRGEMKMTAVFDEHSIPIEILVRIIDHVPCFNLSSVAAVSKRWRTAASESYHIRVNQPFQSLSKNVEFIHPDNPNNRYMIEGYQKLKERKEKSNAPKAYVYRKVFVEETENGPHCRFQMVEGGVRARGEGRAWKQTISVPDTVAAAVLPFLPLEKDLPEPLLYGKHNTVLSRCSMDANGLLFLLFTRVWTPDYVEAIYSNLPEEEQNADRLSRYRENQAQDDAGRPRLHFLSGIDVWGALYHVTGRVTGKYPPKATFVDAKRLCREDFPVHLPMHGYGLSSHFRSENGRVFCLATGVATRRQQGQESAFSRMNSIYEPGLDCIPMIRTFFLDVEKGIQYSSCNPLVWPVPDGLLVDGRCNFSLAFSPSGDCFFGSYYDNRFQPGAAVRRIGCVFYQYDKCSRRWEKKWEKKIRSQAETGWTHKLLDGYYTADGDFCITENECCFTQAPGPMAANRLFCLDEEL